MLTPYHILAIVFALLVKLAILFMLYRLNDNRSPLLEKLNNSDFSVQSDSGALLTLKSICKNYSEDLSEIQAIWKSNGNYFNASIKSGTKLEEFALYLEKLGIARKQDSWIPNSFRGPHSKFTFDRKAMLDLLKYQD